MKSLLLIISSNDPHSEKSIYKQPNPGKDEEHLESHRTNLVLLEFEESTSLSY
jgi:hypothetical protein